MIRQKQRGLILNMKRYRTSALSVGVSFILMLFAQGRRKDKSNGESGSGLRLGVLRELCTIKLDHRSLPAAMVVGPPRKRREVEMKGLSEIYSLAEICQMTLRTLAHLALAVMSEGEGMQM
jgi:hypothetical protein